MYLPIPQAGPPYLVLLLVYSLCGFTLFSIAYPTYMVLYMVTDSRRSDQKPLIEDSSPNVGYFYSHEK
jgi:hypothetical protein